MSKRILIIISIISLLTNSCQRKERDAKDIDKISGTITISGAWALYPMAIKWAEEYRKICPAVKIDISAGGAGKGMADALAGVVDLGMVSRDIYPDEIKKRAWWVSVTKDAVVPTINENNPFLDVLLRKGVPREILIDIWITGKITNWEEVVNQKGELKTDTKINVYTRSDACGAAETWAKFLGKNQEDLLGIGVFGDPGLAEAVRKDVLGIGYNNINYAYDTSAKSQIKGLRVLPIDLNGNGEIDEEENFYTTRDDITKAIEEGKYPSPPARDLHFVCKGKPRKKIVINFIKWVLTDGQLYVSESGYINLRKAKLKEELSKID